MPKIYPEHLPNITFAEVYRHFGHASMSFHSKTIDKEIIYLNSFPLLNLQDQLVKPYRIIAYKAGLPVPDRLPLWQIPATSIKLILPINGSLQTIKITVQEAESMACVREREFEQIMLVEKEIIEKDFSGKAD